MKCPRCSGLMITQWHLDFDERGAVFQHCINCGYCTDPLMEKNRTLTEPELKRARKITFLKAATSMEVEA